MTVLSSHRSRALFLLAALVVAPRLAEASTILATKSDDWQYTFCDPTSDLQWAISTSGFHPNVRCSETEPGVWSTGPAPFGNTNDGGGTFDFDWRTKWDIEVADVANPSDDLWVRRTIDVTGYDLNTISWAIGVDNGFKLYLNNTQIAADNREGFAFQWEHTGLFTADQFMPGINYIALALEDHGGLTAFDMQIEGIQSRELAAVPEPETIALLGLGTLALLATRKRLI